MQLLFETFFDISYCFDNIQFKSHRPLQLVGVILPLNVRLGLQKNTYLLFWATLQHI